MSVVRLTDNDVVPPDDEEFGDEWVRFRNGWAIGVTPEVEPDVYVEDNTPCEFEE